MSDNTQEIAPAEPKPMSASKRYYEQNRMVLLQKQQQRRDAAKDTEEYKLQKQIYNKRHREKGGDADYHREYYHENRERIRALSKIFYDKKKVADENLREELRQRRREERERVKAGDAPARPRGRPSKIVALPLDSMDAVHLADLLELLRPYISVGNVETISFVMSKAPAAS